MISFLGIPPFGMVIKSTQEKLRKYFPDSYGDLISAFIDQSIRIFVKKWLLGMVVDHSFMYLPKFRNFREKILLKKLFLNHIFMLGRNALPDAGNIPSILIGNLQFSKNTPDKGLHRYLKSNSKNKSLMNIFIEDINNYNKRVDSKELSKRLE